MTLPGRPGDGNRPDRPGGGINRPDRPNRPPDPPGRPPRPERPERPPKWKDRDNNFTQINNNWNQKNVNVVNNFKINQKNNWKNIDRRYKGSDWHRHWGSPAYRDWRRDTWRYRGGRCGDIWFRTGPYRYHDHFFNRHWFSTCWWRPRPFVGTYRRSPWWWWRPVAWTSMGFFFGSALASQPYDYDPGTTVIYEGDTVYIQGESAGSATEYRQETIQLANPVVEEIPIPEPPPVPEEVTDEYVEDDPEKPDGEWLPLGVWALTQQEDGDATMFFQLSSNKDGLIGGAYKNVMTGDEQPVVGQIDFEGQRLAWHIGEQESPVYEAGLAGFENDVAAAFVHFGEDLTQEWLLVRMPSPEMPPETVHLPDVAQVEE